MFMIARERERAACFGSDCATTTTTTTTTNDDDKVADWIANSFERFSRGGWRASYERLRNRYSELFVQSHSTNDLATGLAMYVNMRVSATLPLSLAESICTCLVSLYIYSCQDIDVFLFYVQFVTACRFPGQFLKSILLLQGTSDSGKSEFVSDVLRCVYSSRREGAINNSTLARGSKDEINTDLKAFMRSHVCQCDEPTRINAETFKNIVSNTLQKTRAFFSETAQYQSNLAKLIITVNDSINIRSDAGVITRLKYVLRMKHQFKALYQPRYDTCYDFTQHSSSPNVAYQFATKCFARGVNYEKFRVGLFMLIEHFGTHFAHYNSEFFAMPDAVSAQMRCERWYDARTLRPCDSSEHARDVTQIFWRLYRHGFVHNACEFLALTANKRRISGTTSNSAAQCPWKTIPLDVTQYTEEQLATRFLDIPILRAYENNEIGGDVEGGIDAITRNRDIPAELCDPLTIGELPALMSQYAAHLHITLDPYKLLLQKYQFVRDTTARITEQTMVTFLRGFIEENGYSIVDARDMAKRMKDRLKLEKSQMYSDETNMFCGRFVPNTNVQ